MNKEIIFVWCINKKRKHWNICDLFYTITWLCDTCILYVVGKVTDSDLDCSGRLQFYVMNASTSVSVKHSPKGRKRKGEYIGDLEVRIELF